MTIKSTNQGALAFEAGKLRTELELGQYNPLVAAETMRSFLQNSSDSTPIADEKMSTFLKSFPRDCCDVATILLIDRVGEGEFVPGVFYSRPRVFKGHAFLQLGGVIADITADQFGGPRVYVGDLVLPWSIKPYSWDPLDPETANNFPAEK